MDIKKYFIQQDDDDSGTDTLRLPEGSLPSPDDAALPCSTTLGSDISKGLKDEKSSNSVQVCENETVVPEGKIQKMSDSTNKDRSDVSKKKKNKKQQQQIRNSLLTDFFPVRRSCRKPLPKVLKEKHKEIEDAILSGKEEGFEVKEFPDKGRGVVTLKALKRGDFVLEYYGELIDYEEALRRESVYATKENTGCYMYYFKSSDKRYCIDATKESGRLGRLINHSKKGNLKTQSIYLKENPHLAFFACRDIEPGEELCYDYGDRSKQSLKSHPWLAL
ncbi:unnamed protein product [Larinioides sclopetarius]|uniref:[histone H4]-lysine(20) N-methyltransferase n=1 Tax=Larinioides sclopetarius TaxID=280406 RepID=A0AAV2AC90_9ARAC